MTPEERRLKIKEKLRALDIRLGLINKEPNKKTSKSSKEEKLYNKILSNPNISDIDKKHLKRNTKDGTKLDMDDLKAFEKNALMMNDDWSDEEKPKKKSKGNKKIIDYDDENIDDLERVIGILNKKILKTHDVKYNNDLMNKRDELREKVKEIKARPEVKRLIKELDIALKKGEITEDEYESFKYGTIKTHGSDQLALKKIQADKLKKFDDNYDRINRINQTLNIYSKKHERTPKTFNHQLYNDITYLNGMLNLDEAEALLHELDVYIPPLGLSVQEYFKNIDNYVNMKPSTNISTTKSKKAQKPGNIMKARSDLKKKGDKYEITTDMNVRKGLGPKAKKALKESVNKALDKEFKGGRIILDYSSDEEPIKRKRGRPKKGKGLGHSKVAVGDQVSIDDIGLVFDDIIPQTVKHKKQSNVDLFELRQDMNSRNFMRDTKGNPGKMQRNRLYRINK